MFQRIAGCFLLFSIYLNFSNAVAESQGRRLVSSRLERTNLLHYHNREGEVVQGKSKADWEKRRVAILAGMQEVMGKFPGPEKRCPLDVNIEESVDCGTYVRKFLTYSSEPNSRVPAYLLIPKKALKKGAKNFPGVLCLHSTDMTLGHKTVVGLGGKEHRDYARELAERGFVTLSPAYPIMANYQPDLKSLGYESGTMKAIWDNVRGLDLLETLPYVKKKNFGAIGHSLGGHNSIYTAVFEPRIKVIVSSCGFDSYLDYMGGNIKGWTSERYMPKLLNYSPINDVLSGYSLRQSENIPFDFHEMVGALAPRPFFANAPLRDSNFKWQSVDTIFEAAKPVYKLYGAEKNLRVEHPDSEHDFPDEMREIAYRLLEKHLK